MDFRGLVWKRVWKITFFGLKSGQDLKNRAHTPTKNFQEYPPPPPPGSTVKRGTSNSVFTWSTAFYNIQQSELFELILCELLNKMEVIRNPTRSLHPWFKCLTRRPSMWRLRHVTADNTKMTTKTTCLHVQFSVPCWTILTSVKTRSKLKDRKRLQISVREQGTCDTVQCNARLNAQKALFAVVVEQRSVQKTSVSVSSFCCPLLSTIHQL